MYDTVHTMPCSDGIRRAEPVAFGQYSVNGAGGQLSAGPQPLTAAATLLPSDNGRAFSNSGAAGSVTATLPTPFAGCEFTFYKLTNQTFIIAAPNGVTICNNATYTNSANEVNTAMLKVVGISATQYRVHVEIGTWGKA